MPFSAFARTAALASLAAFSALNGAPTRAADSSATTTVRDGSHDFDFIYGTWRMPNHRLKTRLAGSHTWVDFITCDEGRALPGGIGNTDYWKASYWPDFVGVTVRTYDRKSGLWRLYWVDNRFSHGVIANPVVGKFVGNIGVFQGRDTFNGIPIIVRFTWTLHPDAAQVSSSWEKAMNPTGAPVVAKWQQAFSRDDGKTWEINWYNEFIADDRCVPTV